MSQTNCNNTYYPCIHCKTHNRLHKYPLIVDLSKLLAHIKQCPHRHHESEQKRKEIYQLIKQAYSKPITKNLEKLRKLGMIKTYD